MVSVVRVAVVVWVLVLLVRAAMGAWQQRDLAVTIWRRIRLRHLGASLGLFVAVGSVMMLLLTLVPPARLGLGSLVGFSGNAVFAPLETAVGVAGPAPEGPDWGLVALSTVFLGGLALLLPWLAFVEEEVFRAGLEDADLRGEIWAALRFGLAHLVMLIPIGAALAISVAGFVYGRVYRRGHRSGGAVPRPVMRAYRPSKRARRAAQRALSGRLEDEGPGSAVLVLFPEDETRQAAGVLASAVWHTAFNTFVVVILWVLLVLSAFAPGT